MKNIIYLILLAILFSGCASNQFNSNKISKEDNSTELLINKIKNKSFKEDLNRLDKISKEQKNLLKNKNKNISKTIRKLLLQENLYISKKNELIKLENKLININKKIDKELFDIKKAKKKISKLKEKVSKLINKACLIKKGMTREEVKNAIGKPTSTDYSSYYYKDIEIHFQVSTKLVDTIRGCK